MPDDDVKGSSEDQDEEGFLPFEKWRRSSPECV
jgi:hypothetical protein